jgi:polyphosphate glucokinase
VNILVIDVGGSHVKLLATGQREPRRFDSGPHLTPEQLVEHVHALTADWQFDAVSLGYPGSVGHTEPEEEPGNLGDGWVGFDFEAAFGKPVRVVNDAAMQALGGYDGGRMLFLGLGTGLGSALVTDRVVVPLELGRLRYGSEPGNLADRLGKRGLKRLGEGEWARLVAETAAWLREAFASDYVILGGGNAEKVPTLPEGIRRGGNEDAFTGGFRLWEERVEPHDCPPSTTWRVVR